MSFSGRNSTVCCLLADCLASVKPRSSSRLSRSTAPATSSINSQCVITHSVYRCSTFTNSPKNDRNASSLPSNCFTIRDRIWSNTKISAFFPKHIKPPIYYLPVLLQLVVVHVEELREMKLVLQLARVLLLLLLLSVRKRLVARTQRLALLPEPEPSCALPLDRALPRLRRLLRYKGAGEYGNSSPLPTPPAYRSNSRSRASSPGNRGISTPAPPGTPTHQGSASPRPPPSATAPSPSRPSPARRSAPLRQRPSLGNQGEKPNIPLPLCCVILASTHRSLFTSLMMSGMSWNTLASSECTCAIDIAFSEYSRVI